MLALTDPPQLPQQGSLCMFASGHVAHVQTLLARLKLPSGEPTTLQKTPRATKPNTLLKKEQEAPQPRNATLQSHPKVGCCGADRQPTAGFPLAMPKARGSTALQPDGRIWATGAASGLPHRNSWAGSGTPGAQGPPPPDLPHAKQGHPRAAPPPYVGKLLPMRILPRGYAFPLAVTGGLTSKLPKESKLLTSSKRGSLVT